MGAVQSLLVQNVIYLPSYTSEKTSVLIEGVGGEYRTLLLHTVFLKSSLVTGHVFVGGMPSLPVKVVGLLFSHC